MTNYLGDLADIVRASSGVISNTVSASTTTTTATTTSDQMTDWDFGSPETTNNSNNHQTYDELHDLYTFPDPLLRDIDSISSPGHGHGPFLDMGAEEISNLSEGMSVFSNTDGPMQTSAPAPSNQLDIVFSSRTAQISPNYGTSSNNNSYNVSVKLPIVTASPNKVVKTSFGFMSNNEMMTLNGNCASPKDKFIGGGGTELETPSPRDSLIKRRKSQAKKVVCIPAAARGNSRQTGEVVPSDLWAWRKYGQKPIKGSAHPRGYYRCSSSKGCSARKQVERSMTDPNMLVITYTSEHNHPWPTQRNALAGSSRSLPSKETTSLPLFNHHFVPPPSNKDKVLVKEEAEKQELRRNVDTGTVAMPVTNYNATSPSSSIKEEAGKIDEQTGDKLVKSVNEGYEDDQLNNNYRPIIMPEITNCELQSDQDFFKDLVEFEGDVSFNGLFDWTQNITTTTNSSGDYHQHDVAKGG